MGRHTRPPQPKHGRHGRSRAPKRKQRRGARYAATFAAAAIVSGSALATVPDGSADAATLSLGNRVLNTAETRTGDWYVYGGSGPSVFDCSGLVYWAARANGVSNMPRTVEGDITTAVADGILRRTWSPHRGDLAVWEAGGYGYHVGFVTVWRDTAFGALDPGTRVGWYSWEYWPPSAFYTWTGKL